MYDLPTLAGPPVTRNKPPSRRSRAAPCCATAAFLAISAWSAPGAQASGIPYAGNRPESFEFSTDFKESYDSFGQFVQWNRDGRAFDAKGDKVAGPGGDTAVGLSSRLHYFKIAALPNWGWIASITVPEVRSQGRKFSASGIADPLVGGLAFTNPVPGMTAGFQAYVQVPIGAERVTTDTWSFWPSAFYNQWLGRVNVDAVVGGILRGTTHKTGVADVDQGNTVHGNLRIGYSLSPTNDPFAIPFVSVDYQRTTQAMTRDSGVALAGSDSRETAVGLGVLFQLKPGMTSIWSKQKTYDQLSLHYSRGVRGKNTTVTDGLFAQYWHYW
jgi:hypothetical protein